MTTSWAPRSRALSFIMGRVPWAVAVVYRGEPLFGRYGFAVWAGGRVTEGQHAGQRVRCWLELAAQDVGKSAFAGFDDAAGVVCGQLAWQGVGLLGVVQIRGAIGLVQAREGKAGGVTDVVRPRGGVQQIGVSAEIRCQAACPRGDALDVGPAAGRGSWRSAREAVWPVNPACSCGPGQSAAAGGSRTWHAV
jgi:hypothetical protein